MVAASLLHKLLPSFVAFLILLSGQITERSDQNYNLTSLILAGKIVASTVCHEASRAPLRQVAAPKPENERHYF